MDITFCPHCRKQITGVTDVDGHDCPGAPADYEGPAAITEGPAAITMTLNRRQLRAAKARAKKRIRKEKKR